MIAPAAIDHLVLTVRDPEASAAWYARALGLAVRAGAGRIDLVVGSQVIRLHRAGAELSPHARAPTPGSGDLCLRITTPLEEVSAHLAREGVPVELGPVDRTGATGPIRSLYVRDPDGNLVELGRQS